MADITKELNNIKNAVYGRDVRGSIHDGIKKINDESEDSKQKAEQAHDVMESIMNEGFDNAALEANFEQKLDDKIANLQPEWTQFKEDTETQLAETDDELFKSSLVNHKVKGFNVWWIDDDGHKGVYTKLAPLLREYGIKMSAAIITNRPHGFPISGLPAYDPNSQFMSFEQMKELEDEGIVEFVPHSHTHDLNHRYTDMTVDEIHDDMSTCKSIIRQLGWNYKDLVFPFGAHNAQVREVARQYFRSAIDIRGGSYIPPVNQFALPRQGMDTTDIQDIIKEINKAYENDTLIILMSHVDQYGGLEESKMRAVIEHVQSLGGEFITGEEAITNYGNLLQIGEDSIDYNGEIHGRSLGAVRLSNNNEFLADTPWSEFRNGITITKIDQTDPNNTAGLPSGLAGSLVTYKTSNEDIFTHQTFYAYGRSLVAHRSARNGAWRDWIVPNYVVQGDVTYDDTTPPSDFPVGTFAMRITQPNAQDTPNNRGGIIVTTKTNLSSYNWAYQTFYDVTKNETYKRNAIGVEVWGEWKKSNDVNFTEINEVNANTPISAFERGINHTYIRANSSGLPENKQSGNLITYKEDGATRSYQTFRAAGGVDKYIRSDLSDGTWTPWRKFVVEDV